MRLSDTFLVAGLAVMVPCSLAPPARGQLVGPTYDVEGSYAFSMVPGWHTVGRSGGVDAVFSDFELDNFLQLYWGPAPVGSGVVHAVQAAMDGAIDSASENLLFDAGASDLASGLGYWVGMSRVFVASGDDFVPRAVAVRFTVDCSECTLIDASTVPGITVAGGVGAVHSVTGDFTVNLLFEAKFTEGTSWMPLMDFYDGLQTDPGREVRLSFDHGLWSELLRLGDCNEDGAIALDDYWFMVQCMSGPDVEYSSSNCACVDMNEDDHVDLRDVSEFLADFTG